MGQLEYSIKMDPPLSGLENMKIDFDNFTKVNQADKQIVMIRIYEWKNPTISLGFSQNDDIFKRNLLQSNNIEVVRRFTGGRAVLHNKELTYSISAKITNPELGGTLIDTYMKISNFLMQFYKKLNIQATIQKSKIKGNYHYRGPSCFDTASIYELEYKKKKLCGSAQRRNSITFLQHGSIPVLTPDFLLNDFLKKPTKVNKNYLTIQEIIGDINLNKCKVILFDILNDYFEKTGVLVE